MLSPGPKVKLLRTTTVCEISKVTHTHTHQSEHEADGDGAEEDDKRCCGEIADGTVFICPLTPIVGKLREDFS